MHGGTCPPRFVRPKDRRKVGVSQFILALVEARGVWQRKEGLGGTMRMFIIIKPPTHIQRRFPNRAFNATDYASNVYVASIAGAQNNRSPKTCTGRISRWVRRRGREDMPHVAFVLMIYLLVCFIVSSGTHELETRRARCSASQWACKQTQTGPLFANAGSSEGQLSTLWVEGPEIY